MLWQISLIRANPPSTTAEPPPKPPANPPEASPPGLLATQFGRPPTRVCPGRVGTARLRDQPREPDWFGHMHPGEREKQEGRPVFWPSCLRRRAAGAFVLRCRLRNRQSSNRQRDPLAISR